MNSSKQLWVLAGGNGSGKSTFYKMYLARYGLKFVNADLIAGDLNSRDTEGTSYNAATLAARIREGLISQGISFCFETVFSHESKIDFLAQAKANGYKIILIYIHLSDPGLNEARVKQRVSEGGHNVPIEKIYSRIPRTMKLIRTALSLVDEARILDNSYKDDPYRQIIVMKSGNYKFKTDPLPDWVNKILPI